MGPDGQLLEQPGLAFSVVTDPAESDLRRLARAPSQPGILTGAARQQRATIRRDLTAWLAGLCLLLLLLEALLAARVTQWRRRREQPAAPGKA